MIVPPNGEGLQVSYELNSSRRVHSIPKKSESGEVAPHGAGSYHDPEQHAVYMERVDELLRKKP